ncbi:MAG TPA: glucose-6-phosphate dehydrogenase assembly protein OpcA [Solirubrobacteraceae bacterium]|nr:glucose-6-phosphate dehydrogenase assembly protein OpcA [Solirubrobacteraceae bacterium]
MAASSDATWSAQGTTPDAIEAALRGLLAERHAENEGWVPARALNMIVFEDAEWGGEVANRLRGVGRYHASRLVVLSYSRRRERLDARASVVAEGDPRPGELGLLRETVVVELGERHLDDLYTIADPLVVSDLPTLLWSPHGHHRVVRELLGLAQAVLVDSVDEDDPREAAERACELSREAYVVDLAWLRSTPWRERIATAFDPPAARRELGTLSAVGVRHHPESGIAAMLLVGWLASRLGWEVERLVAHEGALTARAHGRRQDVTLRLEATPEQTVRGLAGLELKTADGRVLRLDRGPGGLHAYSRRPGKGGGADRELRWTMLGASRGEGGILGEGIRQALLRDPTYTPALKLAARLAP